MTWVTGQKPRAPVLRSLSSHWSVALEGMRIFERKAKVSISIIQATISGVVILLEAVALATEMSFDSFEYSFDKMSLPNSSSNFLSAFSTMPPGDRSTEAKETAALCMAALYKVPLKWSPKSSPAFWDVIPSLQVRMLNAEKLSLMLACPKDLMASLWLWRARANSLGEVQIRTCTVTERPHSQSISNHSLSLAVSSWLKFCNSTVQKKIVGCGQISPADLNLRQASAACSARNKARNQAHRTNWPLYRSGSAASKWSWRACFAVSIPHTITQGQNMRLFSIFCFFPPAVERVTPVLKLPLLEKMLPQTAWAIASSHPLPPHRGQLPKHWCEAKGLALALRKPQWLSRQLRILRLTKSQPIRRMKQDCQTKSARIPQMPNVMPGLL